MTKEKLIVQYQKKVDILDQAIFNLTDSLRVARTLKHEDDIEEYTEERDGAVNRKQIYSDFIKDLEDLQT